MPWTSIDVPSLALGILTNSVRQKLPDAEVEVLHANLDYVDWVVDRAEWCSTCSSSTTSSTWATSTRCCPGWPSPATTCGSSTLRLAGEEAEQWRVYSHLQAPAELLLAAGCPTDPNEALAQWRQSFYIDKCSYRRGPGFVQVRDRRAGTLNLLVIDDPAYLAVLAALEHGAPLSEVDLRIAREFGEEGLVTKVGDHLMWLPYRLRRWPLPAMSI